MYDVSLCHRMCRSGWYERVLEDGRHAAARFEVDDRNNWTCVEGPIAKSEWKKRHGPQVAGVSDAERRDAFDDELVAALPELEELGVLLDLDPIEADVLFLFDPEDELLIDLLEENG